MWWLLERHWDPKVETDSRAAQDNKSTEWFLLSNVHLWWELTEEVLSASPATTATSQVAQIASIYFFQYWELKGQGQGIGRVGSIQGERFSSSNTTLDTCLSPEAPLPLRTPAILYRDLLILLLCFTWHFHCPKHKYSHILNYWLLRLCDLEEHPESVNKRVKVTSAVWSSVGSWHKEATKMRKKLILPATMSIPLRTPIIATWYCFDCRLET